MADPVKSYFDQFGSDDSDSDDDAYVPEKKEKKHNKSESSEKEEKPTAFPEKTQTTESTEPKQEEIKPTEAKNEENNSENKISPAENKEVPKPAEVAQQTENHPVNQPNSTLELVPSLDNDYYQPIRVLTSEEKEQSNKLVNDYFAKLLGDESDDEEEDADDAEYTKIKYNKKSNKKENEKAKEQEKPAEESDTEPLSSAHIISPFEMLVEELGQHENIEAALASNPSENQLAKITNCSTRLLFLGFADVYEKSTAEMKSILNDLKSKLN